MFTLLRIGAATLAIAIAPSIMAAHIAETGATPYGLATSADRVETADAGVPVRINRPVLKSSLLRGMSLSARLSAARLAVHTLADGSLHTLPSPSLLEQLPMVVAMRRRAGERWNTTDSSRPNDFAVCYRVSRVLGLQVVPGDLTPSKLPTPKMLSVKNQGSGMGVLVGMTFRLGRAGK